MLVISLLLKKYLLRTGITQVSHEQVTVSLPINPVEMGNTLFLNLQEL